MSGDSVYGMKYLYVDDMFDVPRTTGWLIPLPSEASSSKVDAKSDHTLRTKEDGLYEIAYSVVIASADQVADASVYVTRNSKPLSEEGALRQTVGLSIGEFPIPAAFTGHMIEELKKGDTLRIEHDAPCALTLARGRAASLFVRKIGG